VAVAANAASDWAQVAVTAFVGLVTAFVALSITLKRRQEVAVTVAQNRFGAYAALWAMTPFSPELRRLKDTPALTEAELAALFDSLTTWYYEEGHGMLLGPETRGVYLTVKANMICPASEFVPESARPAVAASDAERSRLCVRQLSLLRSAMRADLEVYGKPWGQRLKQEDREFLRACGVSTWRIEHGFRERLRLLGTTVREKTRALRRRKAGSTPTSPDAASI
jgi:hypothetical protein